MLEKMTEQAYFVYSEELEYLLAAIGLLKPFRKNEYIEKYINQPDKKKYQILFEVYDGLTEAVWAGVLEQSVRYFPREFSLTQYENYLLETDKTQFVAAFLQVSEAEIEDVLQGKISVMKYYQSHSDFFYNYLSCSILFEKTEWLIKEFFSFVRSLQSTKMDTFLRQQEKEIQKQKSRLQKMLKEKEPIAVSEELMGKTFYNRGPYETFYFMPSYLLPAKCCRFFEKHQVLFYNMEQGNSSDEEMMKMLKAMADPTRYAILKLLKHDTHLSGMEIAERMGLATSTISHHMTQLKNAGIVNEEPAKNTKLYSISQERMKKCIENLENAFTVNK